MDNSLTFSSNSAVSTTSNTDTNTSPLSNLMNLEGNQYNSKDCNGDSSIIYERNKDIFQSQNESISQFQFQNQSES